MLMLGVGGKACSPSHSGEQAQRIVFVLGVTGCFNSQVKGSLLSWWLVPCLMLLRELDLSPRSV